MNKTPEPATTSVDEIIPVRTRKLPVTPSVRTGDPRANSTPLTKAQTVITFKTLNRIEEQDEEDF